MSLTIAEFDRLRDKLLDALNAITVMRAEVLAGRAALVPDAHAAAECGGDVTLGSTVNDVMEDEAHFDPVEICGWALVRRFWAVCVPIHGADGEYEGDDIQQFATKAEAEAFIASAKAGDLSDTATA